MRFSSYGEIHRSAAFYDYTWTIKLFLIAARIAVTDKGSEESWIAAVPLSHS